MKRALPLLFAALLVFSAGGDTDTGETWTSLQDLLDAPLEESPVYRSGDAIQTVHYSYSPSPAVFRGEMPYLSFEDTPPDGLDQPLTLADAYAHPAIQQAAFLVSGGEPLETQKQLEDLAYTLAPYLPSLLESETAPPEDRSSFTPALIGIYDRGVCALDFERGYNIYYPPELPDVTRNHIRDRLTVYVSLEDGHVIAVQSMQVQGHYRTGSAIPTQAIYDRMLPGILIDAVDLRSEEIVEEGTLPYDSLAALLAAPVDPLPEPEGGDLLYRVNYRPEVLPSPCLHLSSASYPYARAPITLADAFCDPAMQQAAYSVSQGEPVFDVETLSRMAWAVAPGLSRYPDLALYYEGEEPVWMPEKAILYHNEVWVVLYKLQEEYEHTHDFSHNKRNYRYNDLPDAALVAFSATDGHVLYLQNNWNQLLPGIVENAAEAPVAPLPVGRAVDSVFYYFPRRVWSQNPYSADSINETARYPGEELQAGAARYAEGLDLSRHEDAMEYAWRLLDLMHEQGLYLDSLAPGTLCSFTENLWTLELEGHRDEICFSALDGHIVHIFTYER